jgi:ABC-2 type transport system ATP-binding protein
MEATFRDCVAAQRREGRTVLLSSHLLAEAEAGRPGDDHPRRPTVETGTLAAAALTRISVSAAR